MPVAAPSVSLTILDFALGSVPSSVADACLVMGTAEKGATLTPVKYGTAKALFDAVGYGPGPEAAAAIITLTGVPTTFMRLPGSTPATKSAVSLAGVAGTSVITLTGTPLDDSEGKLEVVKGGTVGTTGITFRTSEDNGRTWSPTYSLGTAVTFALAKIGLTVNFAAGTLLAGDVATWTTAAPAPVAGDYTSAQAALLANNLDFGFTLAANSMSKTVAVVVDTMMTALKTAFRYVSAWTNARDLTGGETEADWTTSIKADFASFSTVRVGVGAGYCWFTSVLTGSQNRRPIAWALAVRGVLVQASTDLARIKDGPLPNVAIVDDDGNPQFHDERVTPGLNDSRFATLTTQIGLPGVFVTNPSLMAPPGSDYELWQYRRVMDVACRVDRAALLLFESDSVRVDVDTGAIDVRDAENIKTTLDKGLEDALIEPGDATSVTHVVTGPNILATKKAFVSARITPLGYMKEIEEEIGYFNPALVSG